MVSGINLTESVDFICFFITIANLVFTVFTLVLFGSKYDDLDWRHDQLKMTVRHLIDGVTKTNANNSEEFIRFRTQVEERWRVDDRIINVLNRRVTEIKEALETPPVMDNPDEDDTLTSLNKAAKETAQVLQDSISMWNERLHDTAPAVKE